jgi:hypothetical protein
VQTRAQGPFLQRCTTTAYVSPWSDPGAIFLVLPWSPSVMFWDGSFSETGSFALGSLTDKRVAVDVRIGAPDVARCIPGVRCVFTV